MIKVNNRKTINNLALKSFKANKIRNFMAIIAISLTTTLFTSLFTIGIGMIESFQDQTLRQSGSDGHAVLKYITDDQYSDIKDHPLIKKISYNRIIADSVDNSELLKRPVEMYYMNETGMELGFSQPTTGKVPVKEKEIITDTKTLDLLGVPHKVGATVPLTYTIKGDQIQTDFILSGFWESDIVLNVGFVIVSEEFVEANAHRLENTYKKDSNLTGSINSYIMFNNSLNIEKKLHKVITESGYTIPDEKERKDYLPTDIISNVNWAYLSNNFSIADPETIISILILSILIIITGYLIIYNIFQISVLKDIKLYGLLKTIGTTSKQLNKIITKQTILLSTIGITFGLLIGFFLGKSLLPMVMIFTNYNSGNAIVSLNPIIFIGSSLFSLITVFISTLRPGKIAGKVSPIEAVHHSGNGGKIKKKNKNSTDGGKLWKMALSNLGRNKKRTIIAILSMTLGLVLLNSVFTLANGFDMKKYISKFVDTDFLIGHANYFNMNRFRSPEDEVSENFISTVEKQDGFESGGRIYYNIDVGNCSIYRENPDESSYLDGPLNKAKNGQPTLDLYGMEDFSLSRLDIVKGKLNLEKLKRGNYIIEGVHEDDYGNIIWGSSEYNIGDTVKINVDGKDYEYKVMAKARIKTSTMTNRTYGNFTMYLPENEYLRIVTNPLVMSYAFNVQEDKEKEIGLFLKQYTESIEPLMDYESKETYINTFKGFQNMLIIVGSILSFIIGLIGVLNFINSMFTSIWTRKREFAMLQSIGMTGKQLKKMLSFEGLYYAFFTIVLSLILGIALSKVVIGGIVNKLWFFSYGFVVKPLIITYPIMILVSIIVPYISYTIIRKGSIIERLREIN